MNVASAFGEDLSGGALDPGAIVGVGESLTVLQFPSQPGFIESTILRIRGQLNVPKGVYSTSPASTELVAFGIGVVSDQAATALAVPNPATATGYDWDGWMFVRQSPLDTVEISAGIVDVKAMRKWQSGDSIVFVAGAATSNVAGFAPAKIEFSLRGLFLLP